MRALLLLLIVALAATLSLGVSAEGWSSPVNISTSSGESKRPVVSAGADGSIHVLWEDLSPGNWEVFHASKEPDGPWSAPTNVSNNSGGSFRPAVAVSPDGSIHVAWHDDTPGDYDIFYAAKAPGGSWSTPTNISKSPRWSYWPSIVVGADGSVHVAWHDLTPGNWEAFSTSKAPDGAWSPPTNISESTGTSFIPMLLLEEDGTVNAVWQDDASGNQEILSASKRVGGVWSSPVDVSNSEGTSAPFAVGKDPDGSLRVVWREGTPDGPRLFSATKPPGAGWSAPEDIGDEVGGSGRFAIGVSGDGSLYVVWDDLRSGDREIIVSSRAPDGRWSPTFDISSTAADSWEGALAIGGDGSVHVVWRDHATVRGDILYAQQFSSDRGGGGAPPPEGQAAVRLTGGCNRVTSTYGDSTPVETLAGAVFPPRILVSLWTPRSGDWLGYSPSYPQASDMFQQGYGEALFVCVSAEGEFARPAA